MSTKFVQPRHRREFTAPANIASGGVAVLRSGASGEVGVAEDAIANGATGVVQVSGVHRLPKAAGGGSAIAAHKTVYWDATNGVITETSTSNTPAGTTAAASVDGDTTVDVLINNRPGAALSP